MNLRKELKPEELTVLIDTREQLPLNVSPMPSIRKGLVTGDYSLLNFEDEIVAERKSLNDFTMSIGRERERFDKEMQRILGFRSRCVLIEGTFDDIMKHRYISKINPASVVGSIMGYIEHQIPVLLCGSRDQMADCLKRFLYIAANRRWRKNIPFMESILRPVAESATQAE